jgi:hypothetical protein
VGTIRSCAELFAQICVKRSPLQAFSAHRINSVFSMA